MKRKDWGLTAALTATAVSMLALYLPALRNGARPATVSNHTSNAPSGDVARRADATLAPGDAMCAVDPNGAQSWRAAGGMLVVDVRSSAEFVQIRIPGSVNIPVRELKTKPYLRKRRLLLVDLGYRVRRLSLECRRLRNAGFRDVWLLAGGLEAWRRKVGPLTGDDLPEATLGRVSPVDLEEGLQHGDWAIVDVSGQLDQVEAQFGTTINVPFNGDASSFEASLFRAIAPYSDYRGRFVVLVDRDGTRSAAITHAIGRGWPPFLYLLDGGIEAYRAEHAKHRAILAAAMKPACRECER